MIKEIFTLLAIAFCLDTDAQYAKILDFAGSNSGSNPEGSLMQASDGMLYGMTNIGGASNCGVLFQFNSTSNTYTRKLDFAGTTNGSYPIGSLVQASDGMLYGMTQQGGANSYGVLFQYNPTTNTLTKKVDFAGITSGITPNGSLMQASDGMLYGMTAGGGANAYGVLFQYNPTTNSLTKKFDFDSINGSNPTGSLMQASDGMLYGMTQQGGANSYGVLFQYNPSTSTLTKKLDFAGTANGSNPTGSLIPASDGMLYGMTQKGGTNSYGVLFQYNPSTSTLTKKLDFAGTTNGSYPQGSLKQASDGMLYGMTATGGANTFGVLFQYNLSTSTLIKKLDFAGTTNGNYPLGDLIQASDGMLYGMTEKGGASTYCTGGCGVLFQYNPTANTLTKELDFNNISGRFPYGSLMQASDGTLYGTTYQGGTTNTGTLFQYNPVTNVYTNKNCFNISSIGEYPQCNLMQASNGMLYGMTVGGGQSDFGVLFQYNPTISMYTDELDFSGTGATIDGQNPYGSLIQASDGMLYGMTFQGGTYNRGVLFQYNPITLTYTKEIDFNTTNGSLPYGSLMQASDGMLYGMTSQGGANNLGVLFQYNPTMNIYSKKLDFDSTNGQFPSGSLVQASDGMLYGMANYGGASTNCPNGCGVLFQYNPVTNTYTKKFDFTGTTNGSNPNGSLMQASNGMLYGMTAAGGANNNGTIFQYNPATGIYTKKLDFDSTNGRYPYGNLMQASDGMLYGMAAAGGSNNMGVLFKYCIIAPTVTYTLTNNTPHHWVAYPTYSSNVAGARWYWGDGTDTLALYPSHTYSVAGRYNICVTAYSFCEDSAQYCQNDTVYRIGNNSAYSSMVYINVDSSSSTQTTVVNKLASNNEIIIYPNPAANGFMTSYTGSIQEITLVDVLGNVVLNTTRIDIDISGLANGIYFVNLQTNEGLLTKKLIVQR